MILPDPMLPLEKGFQCLPLSKCDEAVGLRQRDQTPARHLARHLLQPYQRIGGKPRLIEPSRKLPKVNRMSQYSMLDVLEEGLEVGPARGVQNGEVQHPVTKRRLRISEHLV